MEADAKSKDAPKKQRAAHPPPQIPSRPATEDEIPKVAATLAALAQGEGWEVETTYARGTTDSTQPRLVHSVALRMRRGGQYAVAAWVAPAKGKVVKRKEKVATGETILVTVKRKRKGETVEVEVSKPVFREVETKSVEHVWSFEVGARAGRWQLEGTDRGGVYPVALGSNGLKAYLRTPLPVARQELPVDIWLPTQRSVEVESLARGIVGDFVAEELVQAA